MKNFIKAVIYGAGSAIGYIVATRAAEKLSNPVNRAKIKRVFKTIKHEFSNKTES